MERIDFDLSHSVINTLHSSYQGRFAALNATLKMGGRIDAAGQKELQTHLDLIGNWGKALWQDTPLILKGQTSEQADQAFHFLKLLKELLLQAAGETEKALIQSDIPKENIFRELTAIFLWYAYARDNYLKGLLAYCDAVQDRNQAQQYRQISGSCQQEIRMGHEFMLAVTDGLKDPKTLWIRLHEATVNLPGMFRSQAADIDILRARCGGKLNYNSVGIEEREAIQWSQMGITADVAAYWKAYSMSPEETAQWMLVKLGDPTLASSWRSRGFNPKQAAEWRAQGFSAKQAAMNRDLGYTDPAIAKSWSREAEKQQQQTAEKQARQEQAKAQQFWIDRGFSEEETTEWKRRGFEDAETAAQWQSYDFSPKQAQQWKNREFSPKDADAWRKTGFDKAFEAQNYVKADIDLKKAAQWKQGGFNIGQCSSFNDVSEATAYIELGETPSAAVNWKDLKQSPERVKAWKGAGVSGFHQAKQWLDEQVDRPQEAASWIQAGISSVQDV
ncbi:MAG: hypothetical protein GY801_16960, partial [bacterium]|nr:hypothetical protein [bacterium]